MLRLRGPFVVTPLGTGGGTGGCPPKFFWGLLPVSCTLRGSRCSAHHIPSRQSGSETRRVRRNRVFDRLPIVICRNQSRCGKMKLPQADKRQNRRQRASN